jgi:hypothetical protein
MEVPEKLLEIAIRDLESVKILFRSKHYSLALFQLQQAVEKLVKSFGIKTNVIKPEEIARKINHLPHKVFTKLYQTQIEELSRRNKTPILLADMIPPHQRGKSKTKEHLENLKRLQSRVASSELLKGKSISLDDVARFIMESKMLEKPPTFNTRKLQLELKDDFVKTNLHFIDYLKGDENVRVISEHLIANSDEIAKRKVEQYKFSKKQEAKYKYISFVWVNLSLLTSPHEQAARYPSITNSETPNSLYDENNVIIKHIPQFLKMLKKTIKNYREVYFEHQNERGTQDGN